MRELSAPQLLEIWERGSAQTATERALTLLAAARPDLESDSLSRLSVGRRDRLLLSLRESTFGRRLAAIPNCPECREPLELAFDVEDVRLPDTTAVADEPATVSVAEYEVRFRLPDSFDLMTATATGVPNLARDVLRKRCLLSARREAQQIEIELLPAAVLERVEHEMMTLDGQANIQLDLRCPRVNGVGRRRSTSWLFLERSWMPGPSVYWSKSTNWLRPMVGARRTSWA